MTTFLTIATILAALATLVVYGLLWFGAALDEMEREDRSYDYPWGSR